MTTPALICTDGSDVSLAALRAGLEVLAPGFDLRIVTVMDEPDPMLVTGGGFAGGVMSPAEFDRESEAAATDARRVIEETATALGLDSPEGHVLTGAAGPAICILAEDLGAGAILLGTRGMGGLKRAVLGSVSDHVVRHATCPVIVTSAHD